MAGTESASIRPRCPAAASLLGLRPPKDVNVRLIAEETQRVTSFDKLNNAVQALIEQRPKTVNGS